MSTKGYHTCLAYHPVLKVNGYELWSGQVRDQVRNRGDHKKWVASYDGFYLTRGHYSNNTSGNAIFGNHFPEGSITYCSNHSAKTLHKEVQNNIKTRKCTVRILVDLNSINLQIIII